MIEFTSEAVRLGAVELVCILAFLAILLKTRR